MPVDYHIHTEMCGHAVGGMDEYAVTAKKAGLREIGFADHIPMYFFPEDERDPAIAMKEGELPVYVRRVGELQEKFHPYPVKLGIEADYTPGMEKELSAILGAYDFDYVLGSIHYLDGWGFDNPEFIAEYDKWDLYGLYDRYFSVLTQAAASGLFDSLAHPDLIKKFGFRPEADVVGLYEKAVKAIADSGVCVEINTAGLRVPAGEMYPNIRFLELCRRHKIPVTLGSDAHRPELVGANFREAIDLLKLAGYSEITVFAKRNKKYCKI